MEGNLLTPIPTYLTTPASGRVPPPVITSLQELPFRELAWEDFEKLCLRLAQSESDVEHCQLYGTRGQDQEGIDLYARLRKERTYVVYQCKRVRDFGPARIKDAVDEFLSGQWLAKASTFVLCTAESLEFRERADALEEQRLALESRSLTLVVWDSRQLSLKLKDDPKLVNDFFGWAWVQLFCSPEVAASLKDRLDVSQVAELRQELGRFYNHVFNASDPGDAPGPSGNITFFPLQQRFILPDIEETQSITVAGLADNIATAPIVLDEIQNTSSAAEIPNTNTRASAREAYRTVMQRSPVQRWLQNANNSIVLGGPGSGKSTLLRFV